MHLVASFLHKGVSLGLEGEHDAAGNDLGFKAFGF